MPKSHRLTLPALLLALAACAQPGTSQWYHPTKSDSTLSADKAECYAQATRLAERDLDVESDSSVATGQSELQRSFVRFDVAKRRNDLYERCLRQLGYSNRPPQ
jgi:hypothetical protein